MNERDEWTRAVRAACLQAAAAAYEEAGLQGLCAEGRLELALQAIREVDPVGPVGGTGAQEGGTGSPEAAARTVRHFLAALAYRFQKAVRDAPPGFPELDAGHGVRTPLAVIHHMNGVLGYGRVVLASGDVRYWHVHPELPWDGEIAQLHATLREMDALLAAGAGFDRERLERLLQGPLADAMTHVGQLATLRRIAGDPLRGENFFEADVRLGEVGAEQAPPVRSDPPSEG